MKRLIIATVAIAATVTAVSARQLTGAEAYARAINATTESPAMQRIAVRNAEQVYTLETAPNVNALYVFNLADGGYVIAAADDVAAPVLGYSDSGAFDPQDIPENMAGWLGMYADEIAAAIAEGAPAYTGRTLLPKGYTAIEPICQTKWNQSAPYNGQCPLISETRAVTGCSATALSQILKRWNYPAKTAGGTYSYTFTSNIDGNSHTESLDYDNITFDWDSMLNVYTSGSYTDIQGEAVATLMHACGVAMNSSYGSSTGASVGNAFTGLLRNFGYDKGARRLDRQWFALSDWQELCYNELANGRPIYYTGHNPGGGHAFVCDGYSSDDYFHINWGWGGSSDGYFLLTALDPSWQGIGGSDAGYNGTQQIMVGIQPPSSSTSDAYVYCMYTGGTFGTEAWSYLRTSSCTFNTYTGEDQTGFWNASAVAISGKFGIKMVDTDTGEATYVASTSSFSNLNPNYGYKSYSVRGSSMPTGTYYVSPAFSVDDVWYDIYTPVSTAGCVKAEVTATKVTFTEIAGASVTLEEVELFADAYAGAKTQFSATFAAKGGDYYGNVTPTLMSGSSTVGEFDYKTLSINEGDTATYTWTVTVPSVDAGIYTLAFVDANDEIIDNSCEIEVLSGDTSSATLSVTSIKVNNALSGSGTSGSPWVVNPTEMDVTATIKCTGAYWADIVDCGVYVASAGTHLGHFGTSFMALKAGTSGNVNLTGSVPTLDDKTTYWICLWRGRGSSTSKQLGSVKYIKTDYSVTGIEDVGVDSTDPADVKYYNLQGVQVANPTPGQIYIRVTPAGSTKIRF